MPRPCPSLAIAAALLASSCSESPDAARHATVIRLVDQVGTATITSANKALSFAPFATDDYSTEAPYSRAYLDRAYLARSLKWVARTKAIPNAPLHPTFSVAQDGTDTLDLPRFHGLFEVIPVVGEPGPYRVSLRLEHAAPIRRTSLAVLELSQPPDEATTDDPDALWNLAFRNQSVRHRLRPPAGGHNRFRTFRAEFDPAPATRFLLVVAIALDVPIRLDQLVVTRLSRLTQIVAQNSTRDGLPVLSVASGKRGSNVREAIVVAAPATLVFPVQIPAGSRFSMAVTPVDRTNDDGATMRVDIVANGRSGSSLQSSGEFAASNPDWHDLSVDLDGGATGLFDGDDATLTITIGGEGLPEGFGVAVANPIIEPATEPAKEQGDRRAVETPDVIFISLDTVRADRLSPYGAPTQNTPNLDRLARESAVFERAFSTVPWTLASHASMFTGQLPEGHGLKSATNLTDGNVAGLAADFQAAGYKTAAVTAGGYVHSDFGFAEGFEEYGNQDPVIAPDPTTHERAWTDQASHRRLLQIVQEPRRRPLFLFVHTYVAHNYDAARSELVAVGGDADGGFDLRDELTNADVAGRLEIAKSWGDDPVAIARLRELYDATVHAADRLVGDIVLALEASGRLDRTILLIVSDHGEELFEHGRFGHGPSLAEEAIHVPLIVRGPGIKAARFAEVVSTVDLAPTLRDLLGMPKRAGDGRSLAGLLRGERLPPVGAISQRQEGDLSEASLRTRQSKLLLGSGPGASPRRLERFDDQGQPLPARASYDEGLVDRMEASLHRRLKTARDNAMPKRRQGLSKEREAELRELGYLGGG